MLRVVADLRVADKIPAEGKRSVTDLAQACSVLPDPLLRILRALAAFGVFTISADGMVEHTPISRLLRTDVANSMHHSARFWTAHGSWQAWGMLDAALTGETPHQAVWHMNRFAYLQQHPDEARIFDAMMANFPDNRHSAIAAAYDFSPAKLIADIGGGNGAALRQILAKTRNARGLLFDRDDVIAGLAKDDLMNDRITAEGGSFLEHVPSGADIYLLIRVLHDWDDERASQILSRCRAAMNTGATLLIGEELLEPDPSRGHVTAYLIDTHMMTMFGHGRARTESEFRGLLERSGFALKGVVPTASSVSLLEAVPIS